jgi:hypothetical protein
MEILLATIWTALVLYLLYETSAVFSYFNSALLRPLSFLTRIKQYSLANKAGWEGSYSDYMETYHSGFWVSLFSCRYCFGFWLALLFSLALCGALALPIVYFGSQLICSGFKALNDWMVNRE